ncbi:G domain-containing protein [Mycena venus]|uniref:G domain-containing protein n=1 Tax=Mycena venus TaxID=2733690 RepID=A0A8H6Z4D0_9AGAR|nr:G domain-containing protein [Mycena venus]
MHLPLGSDIDHASIHDTARGPTEDEVVIAVMGGTGTGKSSFIKLVTGNSSVEVGESLESETFDVKDFQFADHTTGRKVRIVDTPGFDDSRSGVTDTDILKKIADYLLHQYDNNRKLNGLIYLHRISDPRFGGQSARNLRMFKELCGAQNYKNVVILTTFWSQVDKSQGPRREEQLRSQFFRPLVEGGARCMRHHQTFDDAGEVLSHIYSLVPVNLQITEEIRVQGKTLENTAAGAVLREEVEGYIAKHNEEMEDLQAQMATLDRDNVEARRALEEERANIQQQLAQRESEFLMLKKGLGAERKPRRRPKHKREGMPQLDPQANVPGNSVLAPKSETDARIRGQIRVDGEGSVNSMVGTVRREEVHELLAAQEMEIARLKGEISAINRSNGDARRIAEEEQAKMQQQLARFQSKASKLKKALDDEEKNRGWFPNWIIQLLLLPVRLFTGH